MAEVKAHLNYLRIAPRKVRLVANVIKGMDAERAALELRHLPKGSSRPLTKLLQSAIANATHNFQLPRDGLYVKDIVVNPGTVLKRFTTRAFGRGAPIRKRTSHVSLTLDTRAAVKPKTKKSRKADMVVRDATVEDLKEDFNPSKTEGETMGNFNKLKAKPTNFVRKVFSRKVI